MKLDHKVLVLFVMIALITSTLACGLSAPVTPTPTMAPPTGTSSPMPTATATVRPTRTPLPTNTPNATVTAIYNNFFSKVQTFKDEGLIPSTDGEYMLVDGFNDRFAQIGWLRYQYFDFEVEQFVFNADISWRTAVDTSDTSGCGIVFGVQEKGDNNEYYGVVLDKSRIYFTIARSGYYYELGKTRGTGRLDYGNPAEAEFTILVYDNHAYVYVDDNFVGEYTLSQDKELRGKFGYGIISGTNKDYGTKCMITNARMWDLNP
jgi:hypothetical protein